MGIDFVEAGRFVMIGSRLDVPESSFDITHGKFGIMENRLGITEIVFDI